MATPMRVTCSGCGEQDAQTPDELRSEGWSKVRGYWACPVCYDEWCDEQQAAYDDTWPPPLERPAP